MEEWLRYYRNCLGSADQQKRTVDLPHVPVEDFPVVQLSPATTKLLWEKAQPDIQNRPAGPLPIEIAPVICYSSYEYGKANTEQKATVYPYWIPACLTEDGTLWPISGQDNGNEAPIFVQDYLHTNQASETATFKRVDDVLRTMNSFRADSWQAYWELSETFFQKVTGQHYASIMLQPEVAVTLRKVTGTNIHLSMLYHRLIRQCQKHKPASLPLLRTLLSGSEVTWPLPDKATFYCNAQHLGQMNCEHPLAFSQRQAIRMYTDTSLGEVLAINGPPGTGKTTFLQSVVATAVVDRVVRQEEPALIVASSANNQAIENILNNFSIEKSSLLTERWLPGLSSLGLYLSKRSERKYPLLQDCFGKGFVHTYEGKGIEEKIAFFLEKYTAFFQRSTPLSLEESKAALYQAVCQRKEEIEWALATAHQLQEWQCDNEVKATHCIKKLKKEVAKQRNQKALWQQVIDEVQVVYQALPFRERHWSQIAKYRHRRAIRLNEVLQQYGLTWEWDDYAEGLQALQKQQEAAVQAWQEQEEVYRLVIKTWQAYQNWCHGWDEQYGSRSRKTQSGHFLDMVEDINARLDISLRFDAFWLAVHYREADYLIRLQDLPPDQRGSARGKEAYRNKLQRIACLTPVFISTLYSLPRYATYYQGKEQAFFGLFDLLIVDEAGQVAPDVGVPAFALARRAVVVGDAQQIEPIWSVSCAIDDHLVKSLPAPTEQSPTKWEAVGKLASSGSLMKLAQHACSYHDGVQRGGMLTEHRRCLNDIIAYANQYVYQGKLLPLGGESHDYAHALPSRGYFHINSVSQKQGSSRVNPTDAQLIAEWLQQQASSLEKAYGKPINEIVAIVTPYKAQARHIKQKLQKLGYTDYHQIVVGTVNALQGAQRPIILYSSVLSPGDSTRYVNEHYNLLNVATTRAQHSFLVFGHMGVFNPDEDTPLGNLAKWLYAASDGALSNSLFYSETFHPDITGRISTTSQHVKALRKAFKMAQQELVIVSPFISSVAITDDNLPSLIKETVDRGVSVMVYTDHFLDRNRVSSTELKKGAQEGRNQLEDCGVVLRVINGIHTKTILIDEEVLIEGSFNWLSAVRDEQHQYHRYEASIVLKGEQARKLIAQIKQELRKLPTP